MFFSEKEHFIFHSIKKSITFAVAKTQKGARVVEEVTLER